MSATSLSRDEIAARLRDQNLEWLELWRASQGDDKPDCWN
jgi:hypothetical protein